MPFLSNEVTFEHRLSPSFNDEDAADLPDGNLTPIGEIHVSRAGIEGRIALYRAVGRLNDCIIERCCDRGCENPGDHRENHLEVIESIHGSFKIDHDRTILSR